MFRSVLLIDPDERSAKLARVVLEAAGWVVMYVPDLDRARQLLDHMRPRLIATELVPWPGALPAIRELARVAGRPVVAVTAIAGPEIALRAVGAGCAGVIHKPIAVATFAAELDAYLGDPP